MRTKYYKYCDSPQPIGADEPATDAPAPAIEQAAIAALRAPATGADHAAVAVITWPYVSTLQQWHASGERAKELVARLVACAGADIAELFAKVSKFGGKKNRVKTLERWATTMERNPRFWPAPRPDLAAGFQAQREKVIGIIEEHGGQIKINELAETFPMSVNAAGKMLQVMKGRGEVIPMASQRPDRRRVYALPTPDIEKLVPTSQLVVAALLAAPDGRLRFVELRAAVGRRVETPVHTLRGSGVLAPGDRGLVALSVDTLDKIARGETIRDGRGALIWAPDLAA